MNIMTTKDALNYLYNRKNQDEEFTLKVEIRKGEFVTLSGSGSSLKILLNDISILTRYTVEICE